MVTYDDLNRMCDRYGLGVQFVIPSLEYPTPCVSYRVFTRDKNSSDLYSMFRCRTLKTVSLEELAGMDLDSLEEFVFKLAILSFED